MIMTYTMFFYNFLKIEREVPRQPPHVQPRQNLNLANIQTMKMTYTMSNMYKLCLIPRAHLHVMVTICTMFKLHWFR